MLFSYVQFQIIIRLCKFSLLLDLNMQNPFFTCNQKPLYLNASLNDFSVPVGLCFIYFTDQFLFNLLTQ